MSRAPAPLRAAYAAALDHHLRDPGEPSLRAAYPDDDRRWSAFVRWLDVRGTEELIRDRGPLRAAGGELAVLGPLRPAAGEPPLSGWLAAPLTALDGSAIGALQVFARERAPFGADDEATLVHLAQPASAAVERTRLYPHP